MKEFKLHQTRDFGSILTDTFTYIRDHFKTLGKALLLLVLPMYLISGFMLGSSYSGIMTLALENPSADPDLTGGFFQIFAGSALLIIASTVIILITLKHMSLIEENREPVFSALLEDFGRNLMLFLGLYILIGLAVLVGFFVLFIPGIYLAFKLCLAPTALIMEDETIGGALSRSWDLTRGYWWQTFALYLVMNIISSMLSYALIIPLMFVITFLNVAGAETSTSILGGALGIFYGLLVVVSSLLSIITLIALALHYFNLVERKEGVNLRDQIEELGN